MSKLNAFLTADGGRLSCVEIRIEETPTNAVVFSGKAEEVCWFGGADRI
jgi:6-pyruvoyltetrahydropterin/6-carboxytetrahydropterin synthase